MNVSGPPRCACVAAGEGFGDIMNALTTNERQQLAKLERVIEQGVKRFVEVGNALAAIRDGRLYREHFETFADYCVQTWNFSKQRASQLIQAAAVEKVCQPVVDVPNERVARAIGEVPEEDREAVLEWATEKAAGEPLTAAAIRQAARDVLEAEPEVDDDDSSLEAEAEDNASSDEMEDDCSSIDEEAEVRPERNGDEADGFAEDVRGYVRRRMEAFSTPACVAAAVLENLAVQLRKE